MKKWSVLTLCIAAALVLPGCGSSEESSPAAPAAQPAAEPAAKPNSSGHGSAHSHTLGDVRARWEFAPDPVVAKQDEKLQIFVEDKTGKPINEFDVSHTKLIHLIVVSKDLSYFNHIHPDYMGNGMFEITTQLPAGGDYQFIADVVPKGKEGATLKGWKFVEGKGVPEQTLQPDQSLTKVVDGKEITLSFDGELKANTPLKLKYHITDAATKQPINTLEPYLGAVGHTVILDRTGEEYVHVHPSDEASTGPDAIFETEFPAPEKYKIWGQFQHQGKVFTVSYIVDVK